MQQKLATYFERLWPICRSITGNGLRESFRILQEIVPFELTEVPTGTQVHDWEIPKEWNIQDAFILTPDGRKVADFKVNNLHVLNYSSPVDMEVTHEELSKHIFTLPEQPTAIPYVTSYYEEKWGFCLSHNEWNSLPKEGMYRVVIQSELTEGSLTYGEAILKGDSEKEILFYSYLCHPSMANNELSGPLVLAMLYEKLAALPQRKYTYRFVLAPETIGSIAYLSKNGSALKEKLEAGWVLTCCGDAGKIHYKNSRKGNALVDRISKHILNQLPLEWNDLEFSVGGSDERQFCSPGYNLPIGSFMRTPYQRYSQYHTSLDNRDFISIPAMEEGVEILFQMVLALEINETYEAVVQYGEPQLGKRGLYPSSNLPNTDQRQMVHNMMHLINWSDGEHDLLSIAEKKGTAMFYFAPLAKLCEEKGVLRRK